MGTPFSDVILNYGMVAINDLRLTAELQENPAKFLRKMSVWLKTAVPRFNKPPEAKEWLRYTEANYDDFSYTSTEDQDAPAVIETGKTGFELCSAGLSGVIGRDPFYTPIPDAQYNTETGAVTLPSGLKAGQTVEVDFYSDGSFNNKLPDEMLQILGLCIQFVWEGRFSGDWLTRTPKINDKSFGTKGTEANEIRANTERMNFLQQQLDGELRRFEQALAYRQSVSRSDQYKIPLD